MTKPNQIEEGDPIYGGATMIDTERSDPWMLCLREVCFAIDPGHVGVATAELATRSLLRVLIEQHHATSALSRADLIRTEERAEALAEQTRRDLCWIARAAGLATLDETAPSADDISAAVQDLRERHQRLVAELALVAEALRDLDLDHAAGESTADCAARHLRVDQKRDYALRAQIGRAAGLVDRHPPFAWEELIARVDRLNKSTVATEPQAGGHP